MRWQTFKEDEFGRYHPAFVWAFRATHNWEAIIDLVPSMRSHLERDAAARKYRPGSGKPSPEQSDMELGYDFSIIFKELFCVAAQDLANQIHEPIEKLGVLFEEPLETGTRPIISKTKATSMTRKLSLGLPQLNGKKTKVPFLFGRGQYLLLTRQLDKNEAAKFAAHGYRFAGTSQISDSLSRSFQIPLTHVSSNLNRLKQYVSPERLMMPGVRLACFMVKPNVYKGFDILVPVSHPKQLPSTNLPFTSLNARQQELLHRFDGMSVATLLKVLVNEPTTSREEEEIVHHLHIALSRLMDRLGDSSLRHQAKFSAKILHVPCEVKKPIDKCSIIAIYLMTTIHTKTGNEKFVYVPLRLFNAQQQVEMGMADQEIFTRQLHLEFAHCFAVREDPQKAEVSPPVSRDGILSEKGSSLSLKVREFRSPTPQSRPTSEQTDNIQPRASIDSRTLLNAPTRPKPSERNSQTRDHSPLPQTMSGIIVSNHIQVDISELQKCDTSGSSADEPEVPTMRGQAGTAATESETFVDELFGLLRQESR